MAEPLAEAPGALSGVARVLVNAGKLEPRIAEELTRTAKEQKRNFVTTLLGAGKIKADDLAHTLSTALSVPLLDLSAVDLQRLRRGRAGNLVGHVRDVEPVDGDLTEQPAPVATEEPLIEDISTGEIVNESE